MKERNRLSKEERRIQICDIARRLFIERGLENTNMKDIMKASGISVGGLYHHYEDIYDILKDTIMLAENKKQNILLEIKNKNPKMTNQELIIETTVAMLFDKSDYSILYALLLKGMNESEKLQILYKDRKKKAKKEFLSILEELNEEELKCLADDEFINFFNYIKLGTYYLKSEVKIKKEKELYKSFIKNYIERHKK